MGYKRKAKQYKLIFTDEEYNGFECLMGSLTVDEFIETTSLATRLQATDTDPADIMRMFDIIADKIIRWNLEDDDDKPIEPNSENLRAQDFDFVMTIQMNWMNAMASVPGPLPLGSSNGETSRERMTTELANLSQSLPSS